MSASCYITASTEIVVSFLTKMTAKEKEQNYPRWQWSGSLTPRVVNNDYVTAELIYSTVHARHQVPAWQWATPIM